MHVSYTLPIMVSTNSSHINQHQTITINAIPYISISFIIAIFLNLLLIISFYYFYQIYFYFYHLILIILINIKYFIMKYQHIYQSCYFLLTGSSQIIFFD